MIMMMIAIDSTVTKFFLSFRNVKDKWISKNILAPVSDIAVKYLS